MQEALDERILEASVAAALDRLRKEQAQLPDKRTALERELSLIETRLRHLVEVVATGKGTASILDALQGEEERKQTIVRELARLNALRRRYPSTKSA
jgi:predicted nuclease with TOPRIM domain